MDRKTKKGADTKEKILYESLKLFAEDGYEAVSTRMIARAAGLSDTALYKHFQGKQEIFDTIIGICRERFRAHRETIDIKHLCWSEVEDICMGMFHFQTHDEWMVLFRRVVVIEQFRNPEMSGLYKSVFIDTAVDGMAYLFQELMDAGYMKKANPHVLAMELYAPFFMYHTFYPESEDILGMLREHVTMFRKNTMTEKSRQENERSGADYGTADC